MASVPSRFPGVPTKSPIGTAGSYADTTEAVRRAEPQPRLVRPSRPVRRTVLLWRAPDQQQRLVVDLDRGQLRDLRPGQHQGTQHPRPGEQCIMVNRYHRSTTDRHHLHRQQKAEQGRQQRHHQGERVHRTLLGDLWLGPEQQPSRCDREGRGDQGPADPSRRTPRRPTSPLDPLARHSRTPLSGSRPLTAGHPCRFRGVAQPLVRFV